MKALRTHGVRETGVLAGAVFEKENFPGFGTGVHSCQSSQASLRYPPGKWSGEEGRFDEEGDGSRGARFSAMVPPPRLHRATDAHPNVITASEGDKMPVWSRENVSACDAIG